MFWRSFCDLSVVRFTFRNLQVDKTILVTIEKPADDVRPLTPVRHIVVSLRSVTSFDQWLAIFVSDLGN